jgi:hypothetical protein
MTERTYNLNDKLALKELKKEFAKRFTGKHSPTFYTEVSAYNEFGEVLFEKAHNETVLGGALTVLEKLWGINATQKVDSINNIMGINADISPALPDTSASKDDFVYLWGVGIGGCGDAFGSVRDVKYYEREIGQKGTGLTEMIPFRVVTAPFDDDNAEMYFMMKELTQGHYGYYAKAFDEVPFIRSLWKDGPEGEDGAEVTGNVWDTTRTESIETFVEMHMTLDKRDIREWFELNGEIEQARVNTIGLFSATPVYEDNVLVGYKDVKLFSKFNMTSEAMAGQKTLKIKYRIYAS